MHSLSFTKSLELIICFKMNVISLFKVELIIIFQICFLIKTVYTACKGLYSTLHSCKSHVLLTTSLPLLICIKTLNGTNFETDGELIILLSIKIKKKYEAWLKPQLIEVFQFPQVPWLQSMKELNA